MPFVLITGGLLILLSFLELYPFYVVLGILIPHTAGCSGDVALISYFYTNREKDIVTYDDIAKNTSYFYQIID
jgi:hypothetical protein